MYANDIRLRNDFIGDNKRRKEPAMRHGHGFGGHNGHGYGRGPMHGGPGYGRGPVHGGHGYGGPGMPPIHRRHHRRGCCSGIFAIVAVMVLMIALVIMGCSYIM